MSARGTQEGFSLIELLVSMSIVTLVVMATISAFVSFHKNERVNRLQNESQDEARLTVERLSSQLRNLASPTDASPKAVEKAEPFELVFLTVDAVKPVGSLNARNIKRVRYCVGPAAGGKAPLVRQQQTWQALEPPPAYSTASCSTTGAGGWEQTTIVAHDVVNTEQATPAPIFSYTPGPAPLDSITAIRANLVVDVNPGQSPIAVDLSSRVFLRNQNRLPVASCTATYTGNGNQVALNGSGSEDPEGFNLKEYRWYMDGHAPPDDPPDLTGIVGIWEATSSGTHTILLEVEDQGGLTASAECDW
jgi:prepilin-type N-terminal cleavage/methylation domain-containing protein